MQCCGRSMSLVRAGSLRRLLHRQSACAYHQLGLQQPSQSPRQLMLLRPSTSLLLWPPSQGSINITRKYSVELDEVKYEQVSEETLESLAEYLEELVASETAPQDSDILYSTGVLTLQLGTFGTYVINKQTPNKQIWLSSPVSGPKRFDFHDGVWVYHHTRETLHGLLNTELARVFSDGVDFFSCAFGSSASA